MKNLITTGLFLLAQCAAFAQQSVLNGRVTVFNSQFETGKKQYVANAQVEDDYRKATPTTTNTEGVFRLTFVGIKDLDKVFFNVKKATYEVVNTDALQAVAGQKEAAQVYMALEGVIAENKRKYYQINRTASEKAVTEKLAQLGKQIETLQQNRAANQTKIEALQAQFARVQESFKHIEETARELAERYAKTNLDDASADYQRAFRYFQRGLLDSALFVFQKMDLEQTAQFVVSEQNRTTALKTEYETRNTEKNKQKTQTFDALLFKAQLHRLNLQTEEEEKCYVLLLKLDPDNIEILETYADFLKERYRHNEATSFYKKILAKKTPFNRKIRTYKMLSDIQVEESDNVEAEKWLVMGKNEIESIQDSTEKWASQIPMYQYLGDFLLKRGKWKNANFYFQSNIDLAEKLALLDSDKYSRQLLLTYFNIITSMKTESNIPYQAYSKISEKAQNLLQKLILKDSTRYSSYKAFFKPTERDMLNEARELGMDCCVKCEAFYRDEYRKNLQQGNSIGILVERKRLLKALAEFNYMCHDYDKSETYFKNVLAISDSLRKKDAERFSLDYAEDISRYIRFLATTTGRNAPDSLCIILFDITEKYSHVERALALQKNDFIPDITKYDTAYQNALKEIENYIINDNKSRKKDPEKKMTIEEYSDYLDNLQEKDRIKEDFRIEILEKYRVRHPNNKRICKKLTKEYGDLAWFNLCKKRFKTAENYALKGISIDRLQRWLSGNLAIALLHQGKYEEAKKICLAFRNEQYTEDAGNAYYNNWISGFCGSLKKLEYEYNVKHADSEKLRREFKGNFWCDF